MGRAKNGDANRSRVHAPKTTNAAESIDKKESSTKISQAKRSGAHERKTMNAADSIHEKQEIIKNGDTKGSGAHARYMVNRAEDIDEKQESTTKEIDDEGPGFQIRGLAAGKATGVLESNAKKKKTKKKK